LQATVFGLFSTEPDLVEGRLSSVIDQFLEGDPFVAHILGY
jgi:hypothetical protein